MMTEFLTNANYKKDESHDRVLLDGGFERDLDLGERHKVRVYGKL